MFVRLSYLNSCMRRCMRERGRSYYKFALVLIGYHFFVVILLQFLDGYGSHHGSILILFTCCTQLLLCCVITRNKVGNSLSTTHCHTGQASQPKLSSAWCVFMVNCKINVRLQPDYHTAAPLLAVYISMQPSLSGEWITWWLFGQYSESAIQVTVGFQISMWKKSLNCLIKKILRSPDD